MAGISFLLLEVTDLVWWRSRFRVGDERLHTSPPQGKSWCIRWGAVVPVSKAPLVCLSIHLSNHTSSLPTVKAPWCRAPDKALRSPRWTNGSWEDKRADTLYCNVVKQVHARARGRAQGRETNTPVWEGRVASVLPGDALGMCSQGSTFLAEEAACAKVWGHRHQAGRDCGWLGSARKGRQEIGLERSARPGHEQGPQVCIWGGSLVTAEDRLVWWGVGSQLLQQNERYETFLQGRPFAAPEVCGFAAPNPTLSMVQLSQDNSKRPLTDQTVNWRRVVFLEKNIQLLDHLSAHPGLCCAIL